MNEVIYLEPDEEITSVIDKLKALKGAHSVHLVLPKGAGILQSVVNLKILKREAESLKFDIALVTQDRIGRNLASQVGLTVYDSISSKKPITEPLREKPNLNDVIEMDLSERKPLKPPPGVKVYDYQSGENIPEPKLESSIVDHGPKTHVSGVPMSAANFNPPEISKPRKPFSWKKMIIPLVLIIIGFVLFYVYYPKVTINLTVKAEPISEQIEITVDTNAKNISADSKTIPGEALETSNKLEKDFNATGKKDVGEKAHGEVTLANAGGTSQNLSQGSQIENDGLVFVTNSSVDVPAATASVNPDGSIAKKSGTANVAVEAAEPGEKYNLGLTNFVVDNKPTLSASNSTAFSGGITRQVTIVSADDIAEAQTTLKDELTKTNKDKLTATVQEKKLSFLEASIQNEPSDSFSTQKTGDEADKFSAGLTLKSSTIGFFEDNYRTAVVKVLGDKIPTDKELVLSTDDQVEQGNFDIDFSKGTMKIEGKIKSKLAPKIDYEALKQSLKSKSLLSTENILRQNPVFSSSEIILRPKWWLKKIPTRTKAININKKYSY